MQEEDFILFYLSFVFRLNSITGAALHHMHMWKKETTKDVSEKAKHANGEITQYLQYYW